MHQHLEERLRYHQAVEDALLDAANKSSAEGVKATTVAAAITRVGAEEGGDAGLLLIWHLPLHLPDAICRPPPIIPHRQTPSSLQRQWHPWSRVSLGMLLMRQRRRAEGRRGAALLGVPRRQKGPRRLTWLTFRRLCDACGQDRMKL